MASNNRGSLSQLWRSKIRNQWIRRATFTLKAQGENYLLFHAFPGLQLFIYSLCFLLYMAFPLCLFSSVSFRGMSLYFSGPRRSPEGMATHSSILAWKSPWTEESGRLCSIGSQRIKHDWSDLVCTQGYKLG